MSDDAIMKLTKSIDEGNIAIIRIYYVLIACFTVCAIGLIMESCTFFSKIKLQSVTSDSV